MCIISPTRWNGISHPGGTRTSSFPTSAASCSAPAAASPRRCRLLGDAPFFLVNSDTLWLDGVKPNFARLAESFDAASMDALLLLAPTAGSIGYEGRGDYAMLADSRLRRRAEQEVVPFIYAGAAILSPALFADAPDGAFALTRLFDRAGAKGRLFGLRLEGVWMHVGTPEAVAAAEAALACDWPEI